MSNNKLRRAVEIFRNNGIFYLTREICVYIFLISSVSPYLRDLLGEALVDRFILFFRSGYWPQIKEPRSFNEKILYRKHYTQCDKFSTVADKWEVRDYIESKGFSNILNNIYYVTKDPDTIPFHELPDKFVIKGTHGSGFIRIVDDKEDEDFDAIKAECEKWLSQTYGKRLNEYWYWDITPRVIIEERLQGNEGVVPNDYKFFTFHGEVAYIDVDSNRFEGHKIRFYDKNWEPQDFRFGYPLGDIHSPPDRFDEMIEIAEELGKNFDFARVDLYNPDPNQVIFGEITLAPESGFGRFDPVEVDFELGSYW